MNVCRWLVAVGLFSLVSTSALAQDATPAPGALVVSELILSKTADTTAPVTSITRADGSVFVTVRVANPARVATSIKVSIEAPGAAPSAGARELAIPAQARYRTVARFPARRPAGHYRVVVRDAAGAELSALEFDITE